MGVVLLSAAILPVTLGALLSVTPLVDARRQRALRKIVADIGRIFEAHRIDYWCDFGTLLGLYRDADVIKSDKDADFSVMRSEKARIMALAEPLRRAGYDLTDRGGRSHRVLRITHRATRYHLDVYTYVADGNTLRSDLMSPAEDIPAHLVARRVDATFLGVTIRVPHDVPAVLRHRYGPSFGTPRRGDKGATRPYSRIRTAIEDVEANFIGIYSWMRSPRAREWRRNP